VVKVNGKWVLNPAAENLAVLQRQAPGYYDKRMQGKSDDWIKVNLGNQYGFVMDGKPVHPEYNDSVHSVDDVDWRPESPIVLGFDFGRCYDDQTEVLTKRGWAFFKDVDDAEQVATLDPITRAFQYTDINFKVEYDYDGQMLCWQGTNIDLCITPEHRFPYTKRDTPDVLRWASADELSQEMSAHRYAVVAARVMAGR